MLWHGYYECQTKNGVKSSEVSEMFAEECVDCCRFFFPSLVSSEYFRIEEIYPMAPCLYMTAYT